MNLDGFVVGQNWHESLDSQPVKSGRTVQQYGIVFDNIFQNRPNLGLLFLDELLGVFHLICFAHFLQAFNQIRFEKFNRHFFGDATLIEF